MSATRVDKCVKVNGFFISDREIRNNSYFAVASNRLKGAGEEPSHEEIAQLAAEIEKKFSDSRMVLV